MAQPSARTNLRPLTASPHPRTRCSTTVRLSVFWYKLCLRSNRHKDVPISHSAPPPKLSLDHCPIKFILGIGYNSALTDQFFIFF